MVAGEPANGSFRVRGKSFFFTFAGVGRCETSIAEVESHLGTVMATYGDGLEEYVICEEEHASPTDPARPVHYHAYIKCVRPLDQLISTTFRLYIRGGEGRHLNPYIQIMGSAP